MLCWDSEQTILVTKMCYIKTAEFAAHIYHHLSNRFYFGVTWMIALQSPFASLSPSAAEAAGRPERVSAEAIRRLTEDGANEAASPY